MQVFYFDVLFHLIPYLDTTASKLPPSSLGSTNTKAKEWNPPPWLQYVSIYLKIDNVSNFYASHAIIGVSHYILQERKCSPTSSNLFHHYILMPWLGTFCRCCFFYLFTSIIWSSASFHIFPLYNALAMTECSRCWCFCFSVRSSSVSTPCISIFVLSWYRTNVWAKHVIKNNK